MMKLPKPLPQFRNLTEDAIGRAIDREGIESAVWLEIVRLGEAYFKVLAKRQLTADEMPKAFKRLEKRRGLMPIELYALRRMFLMSSSMSGRVRDSEPQENEKNENNS